jgi:hypothetical protein
MSTPVRVTRALLALQQVLEDPMPVDVEAACRKASMELGLYQEALAANARTEDPFGNQR